jgi:hypothetical protein
MVAPMSVLSWRMREEGGKGGRKGRSGGKAGRRKPCTTAKLHRYRDFEYISLRG